ncbi:MAG: hypothetical protein AAF570_12670, partial [Bacteroidota bacterium]
MRKSLFMLLLLALAAPASAQIFIGPNIGPAYARTADAELRYFPKNEDWISFAVSGGYTFNGPMYFPRKQAECLSGFRNGGWHVRLGARNSFTVDRADNHLFWGLDLIYSRQKESAVFHTCAEATQNPERMEQELEIMSAAINIGYTWNPLKGKTIYQVFLVDFGLRVGYPFWSSAPLLGERTYISGLGFTWFPIRSIAVEPVAIIRWKLWNNRYGFKKGKT